MTKTFGIMALLAAGGWLLWRQSKTEGTAPVEIQRLGSEVNLPEDQTPDALRAIVDKITASGGKLLYTSPDAQLEIDTGNIAPRIVDIPVTVAANIKDTNGQSVPLDALYIGGSVTGNTAKFSYQDPTGKIFTVQKPYTYGDAAPTIGTNVLGTKPGTATAVAAETAQAPETAPAVTEAYTPPADAPPVIAVPPASYAAFVGPVQYPTGNPLADISGLQISGTIAVGEPAPPPLANAPVIDLAAVDAMYGAKGPGIDVYSGAALPAGAIRGPVQLESYPLPNGQLAIYRVTIWRVPGQSTTYSTKERTSP